MSAGFVAYFTFTFVLVVTPGSTTAVVVRNTLLGGRRAGYATALGAAAANSTIAIACGLGLSVLLAYWPGSIQVIHYAGAAFLAWLGVMSLARAWAHADGAVRMSPDGDVGPSAHSRAYFGDGLGINLLSPVIISFYLSVVPSFIPPGAARGYYAMLAATHVSLALMCHSAWVTGLAAMRHFFVSPWTRRALQTLTGVALIALAVKILRG